MHEPMQFCGSPHRDCIRHPMCFLCFFLLRKTQKHNDQMFLCLLLGLGLHQTAYVFLCFCVVVFSENLFGLFFNNKIAPESQCVFVFFFRRKKNNQMCFCLLFSTIGLFFFQCVFVFFPSKKHKTQWPNFFVFFSAIELHQRANVFVCFCVIFPKTQKHQMFLSFFNNFTKIHYSFISVFFNNRTAPESQSVISTA